jgi:hypothetical protein
VNTPLPDLGDLLHDAVDDIEPADRIVELRARTANPARSAARPWFYAAGGVVLATAAAVTAFAVLGNDPAPDSGPAHEGHDQETFLVPAYFVGDSGNGEGRLYREFDEAQGHDVLDAALARIQRPPSDPDYRTDWVQGSFESASIENGTIEVEIGDAGPPAVGGPAAQQVVYTLQGAAGEQLPIQFVSDGEPVGGLHQAAPQDVMLNPMSISDPAEGNSYSGSFTARGRADSFEANVRWELRDEDEDVVAEGFTTADGWGGGKLYKWDAEVDLTGIPFGFYTFVALTDDPSGGEGPGPYTDTRLITVR